MLLLVRTPHCLCLADHEMVYRKPILSEGSAAAVWSEISQDFSEFQYIWYFLHISLYVNRLIEPFVI